MVNWRLYIYIHTTLGSNINKYYSILYWNYYCHTSWTFSPNAYLHTRACTYTWETHSAEFCDHNHAMSRRCCDELTNVQWPKLGLRISVGACKPYLIKWKIGQIYVVTFFHHSWETLCVDVYVYMTIKINIPLT